MKKWNEAYFPKKNMDKKVNRNKVGKYDSRNCSFGKRKKMPP